MFFSSGSSWLRLNNDLPADSLNILIFVTLFNSVIYFYDDADTSLIRQIPVICGWAVALYSDTIINKLIYAIGNIWNKLRRFVKFILLIVIFYACYRSETIRAMTCGYFTTRGFGYIFLESSKKKLMVNDVDDGIDEKPSSSSHFPPVTPIKSQHRNESMKDTINNTSDIFASDNSPHGSDDFVESAMERFRSIYDWFADLIGFHHNSPSSDNADHDITPTNSNLDSLPPAPASTMKSKESLPSEKVAYLTPNPVSLAPAPKRVSIVESSMNRSGKEIAERSDEETSKLVDHQSRDILSANKKRDMITHRVVDKPPAKSVELPHATRPSQAVAILPMKTSYVSNNQSRPGHNLKRKLDDGPIPPNIDPVEYRLAKRLIISNDDQTPYNPPRLPSIVSQPHTVSTYEDLGRPILSRKRPGIGSLDSARGSEPADVFVIDPAIIGDRLNPVKKRKPTAENASQLLVKPKEVSAVVAAVPPIAGFSFTSSAPVSTTSAQTSTTTISTENTQSNPLSLSLAFPSTVAQSTSIASANPAPTYPETSQISIQFPATSTSNSTIPGANVDSSSSVQVVIARKNSDPSNPRTPSPGPYSLNDPKATGFLFGKPPPSPNTQRKSHVDIPFGIAFSPKGLATTPPPFSDHGSYTTAANEGISAINNKQDTNAGAGFMFGNATPALPTTTTAIVPTVQPFSFGKHQDTIQSIQPQSNQPVVSFGAPANNNAGSLPFGNREGPQAIVPYNIFGAAADAKPPSALPFSFGAPQTSAMPSAPMSFGAQSTANQPINANTTFTSAPSFSFGPNAPQSTIPSSNSFSSGPSFQFGGANSQPAPLSFGQPASTPQQPSAMFGPPAQLSNPFSFGGSSQPAPGIGVFQAPNTASALPFGAGVGSLPSPAFGATSAFSTSATNAKSRKPGTQRRK